MKPEDNQLDRLFKAAAQARRFGPAQMPFAVESRVLAQWRQGASAADDWFSLLPLFRRSFALACALALIALAVSYLRLRQPSDEIAIINSVMTLSYLP